MSRVKWVTAAGVAICLIATAGFLMMPQGEKVQNVPGVISLRENTIESKLSQTLIAQHSYTLSHANQVGFKLYFVSYIEQNSELRMEIYENNSLLPTEEEILRSLEQGSSEIAMVSSLMPYLKESLVLEMPAVFHDYQEAKAVLSREEVLNVLNQKLKNSNMKLLLVGQDGYQYLFSTGEDSLEPGATVLCRQNHFSPYLLKQYGFNPLEQEGSLDDLQIKYQAEFYSLSEVMDYGPGKGQIYGTEDTLQLYYLLVNRNLYESFNDNVQAILHTAAKLLGEYTYQQLLENRTELYQTYKIQKLSDENKILAQQAIEQFWNENMGEDLIQFYELLQKLSNS
ncbi:MAG: hypothetical protein ACOX7F_04715 [Eubacteriales bacterium]|jgi:TRAP-type C4-dicarboxylate transport system substrate-binding protein